MKKTLKAKYSPFIPEKTKLSNKSLTRNLLIKKFIIIFLIFIVFMLILFFYIEKNCRVYAMQPSLTLVEEIQDGMITRSPLPILKDESLHSSYVQEGIHSVTGGAKLEFASKEYAFRDYARVHATKLIGIQTYDRNFVIGATSDMRIQGRQLACALYELRDANVKTIYAGNVANQPLIMEFLNHYRTTNNIADGRAVHITDHLINSIARMNYPRS